MFSLFYSIFIKYRKAPVEQITGRNIVEDNKSSPQGSGSPGTPTANVDRAAQRRAEARRMEQERRRREAVSLIN